MDAQLNYQLDADSIVVEVGGWRGDWAAKIAELYNPWILVFEPIREYYEACLQRFKGNGKVAVIPEGLGAADTRLTIAKMEEASSLFLDAKTVMGEKFRSLTETESIEIDDAAYALPPVMDLLSLNCEGAEFLILPRLLGSGRIRSCANVQVQFHQFMKNAEVDRNLIRAGLSASHEESWCVPWGWESWRRKP